MEKQLEAYLSRVDRKLRPLAAAERADIVREIRSEMEELIARGVGAERIVARLGAPEALARAYLGERLSKGRGFGWHRLSAAIAFYSLAGLGGVCVLPATSICAVAFMLCGALCPLAGVVKYVAHLLGIELDFIGVGIGAHQASPGAALVICALLGGAMYALERLLWKFTLWLVRRMGAGRRRLAEEK